MTGREQQILAILRDEPLIPQQELADRLGISRSAVAGHIMNLMQKGRILGKGYILARQQYVLLIGGANMDISGSSKQPLQDGDSTPGRIRCSPGGVARNIAENLARLGNDARLLTVVGEDLYGRTLLDACHKAGVDIRDCWTLPDEATSTYLSLHGPDGEMTVAINDMDILRRLGPERLADKLERLRNASTLVIDSNLPEASLQWIFAHRGECPVFADTVSVHKCRRLLPWLGQIHTLKPNRQEAEALSGLPLRTPDDADRVADWFHRQGLQQLVLSLGEQGICWSHADGSRGQLPAMAVSVANATGAGDALMAGIVHGYLQGWPLADSLPFAHACAALTLSSPATNHPSLSTTAVADWLARHA
ncbi:PfkB family carbohydrate kinase [Vogesella oryzae]|uniref:PfkB family carbohydrate kinase n=1 Tax=Vogesella oryzae TaxID=1735285 RepID=UPI0015843232|nr:PfkB family carbohydrate kinase [Vogesella oryzae]